MDESRIWLLVAKKISNEASQQELAELDAIFKANPGLQYAFSIIDKIKGPSAQDYGLSEAEENNLIQKKSAEIDMIVEAEKKIKRVSHSRVVLRRIRWAAAGLLLLIGLSAVYYFYTKEDHSRHLTQVIPRNEGIYVADTPTSITLQDGTQVWLNSGSTLKCTKDFGKKERQVMLSGEAYFDVKQDADKPFIIQAGSFMKVKVLGTAFNVKAYPNDPYVEASLISGKIAVKMEDHRGEQIILKPHEKVTFYLDDSSSVESAQGKHVENQVKYHINALTPNPVDQHISELSWMRGELAFNDISFIELAYDLERTYHVNIRFKDEQLKEYHLTGVFKGENLNEVLQALQVTTPFHYEIRNKEVIIYR
ncbi:MAG: DUF4974 domain-containing protein [Chitinophagaceae bacterium]|nr:MAG: DUF4974 domain-containing protein [Chitinophagaceae bacterium]